MLDSKRKLGKFTKRSTCRFCGGKNLSKILDLGFMPHAGDYLTVDEIGREYYYPLRIYFCNRCKSVQNLDIISPTVLFKNYHYLSSVSLTNHFKDYANEIKKRFLTKDSFVVEIGSNDGVLLSPLKNMGIKVLGIDPAKKIAKIARKKGVETVVDYFGYKTAKKILVSNKKADALLANNVLAHIDDMHNVFKGIVEILNPKGVLIFEVHYLSDLIKKMQYDFFYSEHLSYYSLSALIPFLSKYNFEIFDIKRIRIHSGSIRVYAQFKGSGKQKIKVSVNKLLQQEIREKIFTKEHFIEFSKKVYKHQKQIKKLLIRIRHKGYRIVGYGAGGRANTLLNFCEIDSKILDYIVDDSPERQGKFTPGTHIPIVSSDVFRNDYTEYSLLLAWNYKDMIMKKEKNYLKMGGKFIFPLPKLKVFEK